MREKIRKEWQKAVFRQRPFCSFEQAPRQPVTSLPAHARLPYLVFVELVIDNVRPIGLLGHLQVVYPCVCNRELSGRRAEANPLIGIDCLMSRHAKFRPLASHGTP